MIKLQENPIKIEDFISPYSPEHGCESIFTGYVRANNRDRTVKSIEYSSHPTLTEKTMHEISEKAKDIWGQGLKIILVHRVGRLKLGEISIYISVRAQHREEAFAASRYLIEELKRCVPIWKQEFYHDGEYEWLD